MSNPVGDTLRPHLSALVDGELEPLEAIAVQRHLRQNGELSSEVRELERLKLAVHLSATREPVSPQIGARLRRHVDAISEATRRKDRAWRWATALGAAAAAAVVVIVATVSPGTSHLSASEPAAVTLAGFDLGDTALADLVGVHRGETPADVLLDMRNSGVLLALETLPDTFLPARAGRAPVIQASWEPAVPPELACFGACSEREAGATLAVLDADRVELPPGIATVLETSGVYIDVIDGVEIRLSVVGGKLFLLMNDVDAAGAKASPI